MAWLWGNGFDFYGPAGAFNTTNIQTDSSQFAAVPGTSSGLTSGSSATRFNSGQALDLSSGNFVTVSWANSTTVYVNLNWKLHNYTNASTTVGHGFQLRDGSSVQVGVYLRQGGDIIVTNGLPGGTILATSPVLWAAADVWHHAQFKVVINNTTGSVTVRLDGNTSDDWSATGLNTRNGTLTAQVNSLKFQGAGFGGDYIDDLYIFNDSGAAPNTWQGDVRAVQQLATSDQSQGWSRSSGSTNYSLVNEALSNQDTNYVLTSTVNAVDTYNMGSLSVTPASIICVQQRVEFRMDDTGPHTFHAQLISGGTTVNGSDVSCTSSYQNFLMATYTQDPNVSGAWTATTVNAAKGGPVLVT